MLDLTREPSVAPAWPNPLDNNMQVFRILCGEIVDVVHFYQLINVEEQVSVHVRVIIPLVSHAHTLESIF